MLRTNLSTRPFYNERAVSLAVLVVAVIVAALTVFNVVRVIQLTREDRALTARVGATERHVAKLRDEARRVQANIDRKQLEAVVAAAREANGLIDARTFSWTDLLNRLETTLPPDVRIASIRPVGGEDQLEMRLAVLARRPEDIDAFVGQLEKD